MHYVLASYQTAGIVDQDVDATTERSRGLVHDVADVPAVCHVEVVSAGLPPNIADHVGDEFPVVAVVCDRDIRPLAREFKRDLLANPDPGTSYDGRLTFERDHVALLLIIALRSFRLRLRVFCLPCGPNPQVWLRLPRHAIKPCWQPSWGRSRTSAARRVGTGEPHAPLHSLVPGGSRWCARPCGVR